jgi:hypothetical protein
MSAERRSGSRAMHGAAATVLITTSNRWNTVLSFISITEFVQLPFGPLNVDNLEVKLSFPELIDSFHTENVITHKYLVVIRA